MATEHGSAEAYVVAHADHVACQRLEAVALVGHGALTAASQIYAQDAVACGKMVASRTPAGHSMP
jgi:hypothetical protein